MSAPGAAHLSARFNALFLLGVGLAVAAVGATGTALAPSFPALLAFRVLSGIGCGPFISLASPLVDDSAPRTHRAAFLAILFVCIPVGFSLGYVWATLIATRWGWRAVFLFEAGLMAPLAATILLMPRPSDIKRSTTEALPGTGTAFFKAVASIIKLPTVVLAMVALACFNGALGGFSFYGSKAAKNIFNLDSSTADLLFGGATVVTGVIGTLGGGFALDKMGPSMRSALLLCVVSMGVATLALGATFAFSHHLWSFSPGLIVGETALFAAAAPATAVLLWGVPADYRPIALALSEIANHVLGDIPLPPLLGLLQESYGKWRVTMCVNSAVLGLAAVLFMLARSVASHEAIGVVVADIGDISVEEGLDEPLLAERHHIE